jgi:hypothetical protein
VRLATANDLEDVMSTVIDQAPEPPIWARNTVAELGGVTHETVSDVHPRRDPLTPGLLWSETDLSMSVQDRPTLSGWVRSEPMVNVEGGTFTLPEARRLVKALTEVLEIAEAAAVPDTRAGRLRRPGEPG